MDHLRTADAEEDSGSLTHLAPSPHSEAVAHEFQELSLQPCQYLPPLNERKNGEYKTGSRASLLCHGEICIFISRGNVFNCLLSSSEMFFFNLLHWCVQQPC
uniref:Uncharacterized protein n=1 Tax=Pelusios castaneus TaxID=367368 RepID=A0A8C8R5F2_9SAUR